jgi:hypothetical protein
MTESICKKTKPNFLNSAFEKRFMNIKIMIRVNKIALIRFPVLRS